MSTRTNSHMNSSAAASSNIGQSIIPGKFSNMFRGINLLRQCVQQRVACGKANIQRNCRGQSRQSQKQIVERILKLWASLPTETIKQSLKSSALNINVDGLEDVIHCFKESWPCAAGCQMLKSQTGIPRDLEDENPFLSIASLIQM